MKILRFAAIGLLAVGAGIFGWRAVRSRLHPQIAPPSAPRAAAQPASPQAQNPSTQALPANAPAAGPAKHLGPFSIAGQDYTVELETRKVNPASGDKSPDTVVAMEIRDTNGAVQFRRTFPYVQGTDDEFETWSVSALHLVGTHGTGLLVSYDAYSEPSAPEEEPTGWFQVFGVVNGKLAPFGAPLLVQGGLLDEFASGNVYKAARALDAQADAVEFKVWTGHCRLIFPVRVDWEQGKLSPAQECAMTGGEPGKGCQYKIVPEDKLYTQGVTFVRLWPKPDEKSGPAANTIVKQDSKVDLLAALVATQWAASGTAPPSANSNGPLADAGSIGVASDVDLWLQVRIDGKEGWMHSDEDFRALGLPEDE
jgi:hypothetical protein